MKKTILVFALLIIILLNLSRISTFEQKNKVEIQVDSKIYKEFESNEKVKVIVLLKEESNKSAVASSLSKDEFKLKHKYNIINGFSGEVTAEGIEKLKSDSRVEKIEFDYPVRAFLQDSVPLINATNTWNVQANGKNITGLYETVCIIDTGVNYSHPDLGGGYGENNASSNYKVLGGYDFVNNDSNPMDDYGHGTHVAGIVSANGSIKGVAPDSKIIAIKALDYNGDGTFDNIIAGIDWCVNNASAFNISVISMSLGTLVLYDDYCDDEAPSMKNAINSAISKNISVIIATGNSESTTSISSPACIQNSTAVAASTKADAVASYSNRNNITDLIAPGSGINSTMIPNPAGLVLQACGTGKAYCSLDGTSMSTPHVAGAFALLYQYNHMNSRNVTPQQIQNALNSTGKQINDTSGNNLNYSRINIYSALLSFDTTAPNVTLNSPQNNANLTNANVTFNCTAKDGFSLSSITLYGNWTGSWIANETNSTPTNNTPTIFTKFLNGGIYAWNCYACDNFNNCNFSSSNYTINATYNDTIFNSSFESGNLINISFQSGNSTHRYYKASINYSTSNFSDTHWWYYFSIENALNKIIRIELENLSQGDFTDLRWQSRHPLYSYNSSNAENWTRFPYENFQSGNATTKNYSITITPTQDRVWIAPVPPYTITMRDNLFSSYSSSPYINVTSLGITPSGKNLTMVTITDSDYDDSLKYEIYIIAQQHAFESVGSFQAEGMIKFLLNETDETAEAIRKSYIFKIIPIMNPDGVYYGISRYTPFRSGSQYDLNRAWDDSTINTTTVPEVNWTFENIKEWNSTGQVHAFLDLHGDSVNNTDLYYLKDGLTDSAMTLFLDNLSNGSTGNKMYWPETLSRANAGSETSPPNIRTRIGIHPSVLLEAPYDNRTNLSYNPTSHNPQNITDWQDWGKKLVLGIYDYFGGVYPEITLNSPSNSQQLTSSSTITFSCSAESTVGLSNATLYGNWSGWSAKETNSITGTSDSTSFSQTIDNGAYVWNCYSCDILNNCSFYNSNSTFSVQVSADDGDDGGGGGGGGGSAMAILTSSQTNETGACEENWNCGEWSKCINNSQARICTDLNSCGTAANKPVETQICSGSETNVTNVGTKGDIARKRILIYSIAIIIVVIISSIIIFLRHNKK